MHFSKLAINRARSRYKKMKVTFNAQIVQKQHQETGGVRIWMNMCINRLAC